MIRFEIPVLSKEVKWLIVQTESVIHINIYIMLSDKERIEKIIQEKHLSNVEFCNETAMSPSTLSHILSERTKPTLAILRNVIEAFPDLNPMWIFMGQGEMYAPSSGQVPESGSSGTPDSAGDIDDFFAPMRNGLASTQLVPAPASKPSTKNQLSSSPLEQPAAQPPTINVEEVVGLTLARLQKPQRKVTEVRIFFDDGTYETFSAN